MTPLSAWNEVRDLELMMGANTHRANHVTPTPSGREAGDGSLHRVGRRRACVACGGTGLISVNANRLPRGFALWLGKVQGRGDGRSEVVCPHCSPATADSATNG